MPAYPNQLNRLLAATAALAFATPAFGLVVLHDGFGDADRNHDGVIDDLDFGIGPLP